MTFVFDATPLIYLAKTDSLGILTKIEREFVVPERVYDEVVTDGMKQGYTDAKRIDNCVQEGPFQKRTLEEDERFERLVGETALSQADAAVLLLADEVDGTAVVDEKHGRDIADVENIETRGTAYLLLSLVRRGDLSAEEARDTIDAMLDAGWHCSPNLYAKLLRKLNELATE
ncbi:MULTISPECIES: DUF3368 domain-containing protein [Halorussus]|uniref:DUF3368 domain-containing protein n=1 Tax=Halorussus TaxID=1070314 RepID=UPI000E215122|nr:MULTISPECIES: DUF3368 domain-containing protein [Halorussus]NHN60181.1 DUF3368 domain-containing protein [Halorussus sp. JP-T4]